MTEELKPLLMRYCEQARRSIVVSSYQQA